MISIQDLEVVQGNFRLERIHLEIPANAYAILMGPTASGKTTILESLCGLRAIRKGKILVNQEDVTQSAPFRRNIGYVPQESVLFPAMRVDRQIEFSLDVRGFSKKRRRERVLELAELAGIQYLLNRYPAGLSGGEKQRVALARALAFRPNCLCLDEPLAALDEKTRDQIADLLKRIHREQNVSILHVTHNQAEALNLGTIHFRIEDGCVKQTNE